MNDSTGKRPVLIMAGGTGGHVFPALAVARKIQEKGVPVCWLGTEQGLEAKVVNKHEIPIRYLAVKGIRGKGLVARITGIVCLLISLVQALGIVISLRPRCSLGLGGYVAGPGGVASWLCRVPLVIHEQNSVAGMTNRLLSRLAKHVLEAFPGSFPGTVKVTTTGNPVRKEFGETVPEADEKSEMFKILIVGGSLGAKVLNEIVPEAIALQKWPCSIQIRHQAGERTLKIAEECYKRLGVEAEIVPFIDDIAGAYRWADLVVCRAGALTVSELAAVGVVSILVPLPHAVDDHQTGNARYLSDNGAAVLIPQPEFKAERLAQEISRLIEDPELCRQMSEKAKQLAVPDAAEQVAKICLEAA